jgi:hypothetical protein
MLKSSNLVKILFIAVLLVSLNPTSFAAESENRSHTYHTSLTRIDYNADQKLFEISIQLFTHDLQPLLEKRKGSRIDLEKTPGVDKLILDYLNENFILSNKSGEMKKFKWVGMETDIDAVWVYLETPSTESPEGFNLQNTIFFESFAEQANLVVCYFADKKADLVFKAGDRIKAIAAESAKPAN